MKLLIVTLLEEHRKEVLSFFEQSGINAFSTSEIEGHKFVTATDDFFHPASETKKSLLFFSFTKEENITPFFKLVTAFNHKAVTHNPLRVVVLPVERALY
jgi:hypothetical protein